MLPYEDDHTKGNQTYLCSCIRGFGFNPSNGKCEKCQTGQGFNLSSNQCVNCKDGKGLNSDTMFCQVCPSGLGIDSTSRFCIKCKEGEGINPTTKVCQQCQNGEGIDADTKICGSCKEGFGIDSKDKYCRKCSDANCISCTNDNSICTECNTNYTVSNGACVTIDNKDQLVVITPVPEPTKVPVPITTSGDIIQIEQSSETENTNYVASIRELDKTVIVNNIGQSNLGLVIGNNAREVTIYQNTTKPLEIIINNNSNNPVSNF